MLDFVQSFGRRRPVAAFLGAPPAPVQSAIDACADKGGIQDYVEPDAFSFQVTCNNGQVCAGGAEQNTSCGPKPSTFLRTVINRDLLQPPRRTTLVDYSSRGPRSGAPDAGGSGATSGGGSAAAPSETEKSNTGLYVGLGIAAVAVIGSILYATRTPAKG